MLLSVPFRQLTQVQSTFTAKSVLFLDKCLPVEFVGIHLLVQLSVSDV